MLDVQQEYNFWSKNGKFPLTKDDKRVIRSYINVLAKCEISMKLQNKRINQRHFQSEKELEDYCFAHGLIYSPTKYPL